MTRKNSRGKGLVYTSAMITAIIVLSVFTAGIAVTPAGANEKLATVTRALPDYVEPNDTFTVTLTQSGFVLDTGIVWEVLPDGFEYVDDSYTGSGDVDWSPATRTLMMQFKDETSIAYRVNAGSNDQTTGFSGTYKAFVMGCIYKEEGDITGDTEVNVDGTPPYTDEHNPAKGATGVPVDTNVVVHVKDNFEVDPYTIAMTVNGNPVSPSIIPAGPGTTNDWVVRYNPLVDFGSGEVVAVTVDASDVTGNAMLTDVYSFTTVGPPVPEDTEAPAVTNANATPSIIPDDTDNIPLPEATDLNCWDWTYTGKRWETSQLNVTVTDASNIVSVKINLSSLGGDAEQEMTNIPGTDIWTVITNASNSTAGWNGTAYVPYQLQVNATDEYGNSNTSVGIELMVMKNGDVTGNGVVDIGDAMLLANYVSFPGQYTISSETIGEITGNGVVDIGDAMLLANYVSFPSQYILR